MMATLGGYLFTLMARRPLGLQGTRGGPGLGSGSRSRRTRGGPGLGSGSWSRRTRGGPGLDSGSGSHRTRGGPGAGQRELEPQDTWRPRSCVELAAGDGAAGHVAAPKPTSAGRRGPELQLAWQRVDTRPAPCLDLELVCGVPGLQGTDRNFHNVCIAIANLLNQFKSLSTC
jgi:hypothetical protein